jgi:nucleoside-diphosphate-sugar epimerase
MIMRTGTEKILVIGANGQLGTELTEALRKVYGTANVVASDLHTLGHPAGEEGPFEILNVLDERRLREIIREYRITQVYHLAALLSAVGERKPKLAWELNVNGLLNVLETAREGTVKKVFWPSTIAVFGPNTPREHTPQHTVTDPTTIYGISKLAGERWCEYYCAKYGIDVRGLRYPGLISYKNPPGGGTTDYAVDIYLQALETGTYQCYLSENTYLPMMYMPDAVRATLELMEADTKRITIRSGYNIGAISFSPREIAAEIKKHIPQFTVGYQPDFRQQIADTWPQSIDDSTARHDWGWQPQYDLAAMTRDMLTNLKKMRKPVLV